MKEKNTREKINSINFIAKNIDIGRLCQWYKHNH